MHPNPVRLANAHSLLDIVDCFSFVRSTLRGARPAPPRLMPSLSAPPARSIRLGNHLNCI